MPTGYRINALARRARPVPTRLRSVVLVAVVLVAADLAGATNPAIDIRVAPFAPEERRKMKAAAVLPAGVSEDRRRQASRGLLLSPLLPIR